MKDDRDLEIQTLLHEITRTMPGMRLYLEDSIDRIEELIEAMGVSGDSGLSPDTLSRLKDVQKSLGNAYALSEMANAITNNYRTKYGINISDCFSQEEMIDVWELISECLEIVKVTLPEDKKLEFKVQLMDRANIWGYENDLKRALLNILDNAVKYSFRESEQHKYRFVEIRGRRWSEEGCAIKVINYGYGVLPEEWDKVLEYGKRGIMAKDAIKSGTGIGLAEALNIARRHGGGLWIDSRIVAHGMKLPDDVSVNRMHLETIKGLPWQTTVTLSLLGVKRRDGRL